MAEIPPPAGGGPSGDPLSRAAGFPRSSSRSPEGRWGGDQCREPV